MTDDPPSGRPAGDPDGPGSLAGDHALVTGATRGIGWATAKALAGAGADVTLLARSRDRLDSRCRELSGVSKGRVHAVSADIASPDALAQALDAATDALGAPTLLINNAGIAESAPFLRTAEDVWAEAMAINFHSIRHAVAHVLPAMIDADYGRIVTVASTAGLKGYPYVSAYCAAKHAAVGLTRALAVEFAATGITINAVAPGFVDTEMTAASVDRIVAQTGRRPEEALESLVSFNPQGRLIQPGEVADAVLFLCRRSSASITGQVLSVAGGEVT